MKKILAIIILTIIILSTKTIYASDTEEIIKEQEAQLGITEFIKQAQKYTSQTFEKTDINNLYKSALTGEIKAEGIMRRNTKTTRKRSNNNNKKPRIHTNHYNNT